eukprot:GHRQ01034121.1.p1 GENE.GHRQ01034121.1~~GHRQ01034121.1.p1  ORF type:complete len:293 (+),score=79.84 GHRQ01034121.1:272-1150(+)
MPSARVCLPSCVAWRSVSHFQRDAFAAAVACITTCCCLLLPSVRGDLIRILNKLLKRKSKFDAILIETTGLANPAPVIQTFFVDEDLKESCQLDAVLCLVDAKHITQHLDEVKPEGVVNEAVQQVAFADRLLLNKIDLVSEAEKAAIIKRIRAINRGAELVECTNAAVDLAAVLGIQSFSMDKMLELDPDFLEDETQQHKEHHHHDHHCDASCTHEHHHHDHECDTTCSHEGDHHSHLDHKHDSSVTSVGIVSDGSADMRKLNAWLSGLLQERGPDLFRSKGILAIHGSDDK